MQFTIIIPVYCENNIKRTYNIYIYIYSVGRMQNFSMSRQVVRLVTTGLQRVNEFSVAGTQRIVSLLVLN